MRDDQSGGRHLAERALQATTGSVRDIDALAGLQAAGVQQLAQGYRLHAQAGYRTATYLSARHTGIDLATVKASI